jgi:predicted DNA-binding transcriptional regulator YafY
MASGELFVSAWGHECEGSFRLARNDQIVRILTVAHALSQSRRGISLKTLAARHGWSWRTLYRDVEALNRAGFPVETVEGRHRLMEGWCTPHLPGIESDEIATLYALRALCEGWRQTAIGRPLDRLWMKLTATADGQGALMPIATEPWLAVRSPFGIDYRAHDKTIATFDRATREHLAVNCRYRAISTGETTARVIEPGELYWDPGLESLYVIAWCRLRNDVRVFAAHRFLAAALTDDRFTTRPETRSKAALRGAFRVWRERNISKVRVLFAAEVAPEIRERTWALGHQLEEVPDSGGVVLTVEVAGLPEIERWILGYGDRAEVLTPAELRQSVAARVTNAATRYAEGVDGMVLSRRSARRMPTPILPTPKDKLSQGDNAKG